MKKNMMTRSSWVAAAVLLVVASPLLSQTHPWLVSGKSGRQLEALKYIPKDALFVWASSSETMAETYEALLMKLRELYPEERAEFDSTVAEIEAQLGFRLSEDFLKHLGPQYACVVDLPSSVDVVRAFALGDEDDLIGLAGGVGCWMRVGDEDAVRRGLVAILSEAGTDLRIDAASSLMSVCPDGGSAGDPGNLCLHGAVSDGVFVFGFSRELVTSMLAPLPSSRSLSSGADYSYVRAQLDKEAESLIYVNLPLLRRLIAESEYILKELSRDEEARRIAAFLLDPDLTPHGLGISTVIVKNGARSVVYGPDWLRADAAGKLALTVMSIAIPNIIDGAQRSRTKRTMADMRTLGTAVEAFAVDHGHYPEINDWAPCAEIESELSPVYVRTLPTTDAWGSAFQCRSDGRHVVIVSPGGDGVVEEDYKFEEVGRQTRAPDDDIVYSDGIFVVYPEGISVD